VISLGVIFARNNDVKPLLWGFAPYPTFFFGLIQKRKQKRSRQNDASSRPAVRSRI
jgi:hypothetical protein